MKFLKFIFPLALFFACSENQNRHADTESQDTIIIHDTVIVHDTVFIRNEFNWQRFGLTHDPQIDSIWGKPVKFYISNPDCSPIAIDFYYGSFRPMDNYSTASLLALATTNNNDLRPFYRWCLNKTIHIADGALGEYTGVPARQYAEKFPIEFFEYMDYDTSGQKYNEWVSAIMYSGYYKEDNYKKPGEIRKSITQKMKANCKNCNEQFKKRIDKFAADCFPDPKLKTH